ncbi:histone H2B domain-containing protein [Cavenderia fasciculata]|uniref:Histone H2B domain-containing protein n=1 Tax=Cavenderia fasciculata TaxID=261658 RepID=F4Q2T8_CACFS|nr:histone H2B domain-containing protein [Cavenderia fasciculata]EGG16714.1 histone H2B domain-containing protein [Cavenderia fasciculata]|eukprot:XP_004355188.1 histone H2B domain-containing protein [Cavenderia fasciculata]
MPPKGSSVAKKEGSAASKDKATTPKVAKTPAADGEKPKKKKKKADYTSFSIYIHKLLRQISPSSGATEGGKGSGKITISSKAMDVMNSFVHDIFERIATEAGLLARKKKRSTLHSRDIQIAVRIILSGELAKHAIVQGMAAVTKLYNGGSAIMLNSYILTLASVFLLDGCEMNIYNVTISNNTSPDSPFVCNIYIIINIFFGINVNGTGNIDTTSVNNQEPPLVQCNQFNGCLFYGSSDYNLCIDDSSNNNNNNNGGR